MAYRPINTQERILHRLKIARGHLDKVVEMIEDDAYCIDVLHQMQAVESGLKETGNVLLENHLNTCVVDHIKSGDTKKSIDEIMTVFRKKNNG
jgi:DNA-binding FrmR family transcriptional regulator